MSCSSFQFRYPLNRNPYIADQATPIIYPYPQWGNYGASSSLYLLGRQIPFRSYFGQDVNLTARPISRVIQPSVVEYAPVVTPAQTDPAVSETSPTLVPITNGCPDRVALSNRFAALNAGNQQVLPFGAQVSEAQKKWGLVLLGLILAGVAVALVVRK